MFPRKQLKPIVTECSKEAAVNIDELKAAKEAINADGINPCFLGCVYKKAGAVSRNENLLGARQSISGCLL